MIPELIVIVDSKWACIIPNLIIIDNNKEKNKNKNTLNPKCHLLENFLN